MNNKNGVNGAGLYYLGRWVWVCKCPIPQASGGSCAAVACQHRDLVGRDETGMWVGTRDLKAGTARPGPAGKKKSGGRPPWPCMIRNPEGNRSKWGVHPVQRIQARDHWIHGLPDPNDSPDAEVAFLASSLCI